MEDSSMKWWHRLAKSRLPDFVIRSGEKVYLRRWWVIPRNRWFNIYLHHFLRSDDDRALHDHMYVNLSYILEGFYIEHTIAQGGVNYEQCFKVGSLRLRWPSTAHRIEVHQPCWTLFITGPRVREWGFHCPKGWRHWKEFVDDRDSGQIGRGCEE
jgi:hypothetical protein